MNVSLEAHSKTDDIKMRKAFVPIENNPEVLSALIHKLGLSSELSFYDVFSIEDADLLAFIPRPAIALLLVFPVSKAYEEFRSNEDQNKPDYDITETQDVIWYKQTIRNSCGIMAILHAASNGESRKFIKSDSHLDKLIKQALPLGPIERADLIYNFEALEIAHQDAAYQGQSCAPRAEEDVDLHYVCFIKGGVNVLWELDGRRKGPLNRGKLGAEDDLLSEKSLELSVRSFLKREETAGNDSVKANEFCQVAPANDKNNAQAEQFAKSTLELSQLDLSPLTQFHNWFTQAQSSGVFHPETVCLSTASLPSGRVSGRMVYLKELDLRGFVIYSNFGTSKKSRDLESNKWASLTFWWQEQERQVRVEGLTERLTNEESQVYFDTRIRGSRIGAWASKQSQTLRDRTELEGWVKDLESKFEGLEQIPVPDFWGGLRIVPEMIEFWQGRDSRLHDRFQYTREGDSWKIKRLSP